MVGEGSGGVGGFLTRNNLQSSSIPVGSIRMMRLLVVIKSERASLNCRGRRTYEYRGDPTHGSLDLEQWAYTKILREPKRSSNE